MTDYPPRWRIESCDAGMGETEYRLFRFGEFFCQTPTERESQWIILWNEVFRADIFRADGKDGE